MAQDAAEQSKFIQMTEDDFDAKFTMVSLDEDENLVLEWEDVKDSPKENIWTWVDGDNGETCLISGVHYVNRFGYGLTEEPVEDGVDIEVNFGGGDEDHDESGDFED